MAEEPYGYIRPAWVTPEPRGPSDPIMLLTPEQWQERTGIRIIDPDGWRGRDAPPWDLSISRADFLRLAAQSTVRGWPSPLKDED